MVMALAFRTKDPDGMEDKLKNLLVSRPLSLYGVRGGPLHAEVGHDLGGRDVDFFRGHDSADGEAEGCPRRRLGLSRVPARGEADTDRKYPISQKKLGQGDGSQSTKKTVLGWDLDMIAHVLRLPPRRQ